MHYPTGRSVIYCLHAFICSRTSMDMVSNTEEMNVNIFVTHSAMKIANFVYRYAEYDCMKPCPILWNEACN